jgi:hypothetical protein
VTSADCAFLYVDLRRMFSGCVFRLDCGKRVGTASSLVFTVGAQEKPRLREFRSVVRTGGLSPISLNFVADFRTRTSSMEGSSIRTSPKTEQGSSLGMAQGVADPGTARSGMRSSGTPPKRQRLELRNSHCACWESR